MTFVLHDVGARSSPVTWGAALTPVTVLLAVALPPGPAAVTVHVCGARSVKSHVDVAALPLQHPLHASDV